MVPEKRTPLQGHLRFMSHTDESELLQLHLQSSKTRLPWNFVALREDAAAGGWALPLLI